MSGNKKIARIRRRMDVENLLFDQALFVLKRRLTPNREEARAKVALEHGADAADIPEWVSREEARLTGAEMVAALVNTAVNFACQPISLTWMIWLPN